MARVRPISRDLGALGTMTAPARPADREWLRGAWEAVAYGIGVSGFVYSLGFLYGWW